MLFRRFALALGLLVAVLASQLPEFAQQYRQRLGGAIDELAAIVTAFDSETAAQSLSREQGIARLKHNDDVLAQERGASIEGLVARKERLEEQRAAFATAQPVWRYAILARADPTVAHQAFADFVPAVPVTTDGFVFGAVGLVVGWVVAALLAWPFRRASRRRAGHVPSAHAAAGQRAR